MNGAIELINKIQDVLTSIGGGDLDLPQIITVGSQSSGKSSVLENIVQRDFLPRGSGIVTRRPLVLQLVTLANDAPDYAEFLHVPKQKFFDFDMVRMEIEQDTARVTASNKGISRQPIHLKIYSKHVLNLTLIDLPGLTQLPIDDQPADIEHQIRQLVLDYISKPNSIILAVTPANTDLANSDSLKLARQVDPTGRRTLGVVTKLDLMDAGTHALDILSGRFFPLKLGFVGVVNRSQQDILTKKPMKEALKAEERFFQRHPAYRSVANQSGTLFLTKQLNNILIAHIRESLPDLRSKLSTLIGQTQHELAQYGDPAFIGKEHSGSLILKLLTLFANEFVASIDGTSSDISTKELSGGARIYYIFNNIFGQALDAIDPCANLSNEDIRTVIRNSTGPRCSLFVPEMAFDLLIRPQIKLLEAPSLRCVELAFQELSKICHACENKEMLRFPKLHAKLIEIVSDLLLERLSPTSDYVESLIAIECAYINTNHPDFPGATATMAELQKRSSSFSSSSSSSSSSSRKNQLQVPSINGMDYHRRNSSSPRNDSLLNYFFGYTNDKSTLHHPSVFSELPPSLEKTFTNNLSIVEDHTQVSSPLEKDMIEVKLIRKLLTAYFNIVRRSIQDLVPKAIMHLLVNYTRETVQNRLVTSLYREELFDDLLQEDPVMAADRQRCKTMLDVYKKAFVIVSDAL
ncbi:Dynamin central region-domain-containing protein [Halteromyces radiatus]|uniref:Dynamin central region-domain-containing protein n=1 Tax=Halteromyces radiatus TaxID=101107 RepID=UPI00221EECB2|nr:Dynamin central region-domain-containing protein [Halteromyces radiatus]KAI8079797.1 Dynamin central region-domain-containing protein [Halteromyces radiatus]